MKKKSLLVVLQPWRSYEGSLLNMVNSALFSTNYEISYLEIFDPPKFKKINLCDKIKNLYHRKIKKNNQYILHIENKFYNQYYLQKINELTKEKPGFDYVLVIKPEEFSEKVLMKLKNCSKNLVGYIWDGLRPHLKNNLIVSRKYLDRLYSFDSNDISKNPDLNMLFCTNFGVLQKDLMPYESRKWDVFYIGHIGGRLHYQRRDLKIIDFFKKINAIFNIKILYEDQFSGLINFNEEKLSYINQHVSTLETQHQTQYAKIVIDICKPHHIGLSFRFFECLFAESKIITNNKDIKNYDFYNPQNIMVVDYEGEALSQETFEGFINQPYVPVDKIYLKKYEVNNWINYLLGNKDSIEIKKK